MKETRDRFMAARISFFRCYVIKRNNIITLSSVTLFHDRKGSRMIPANNKNVIFYNCVEVIKNADLKSQISRNKII